ncbi:MAG: proteasome subunit alpha [Armatimonadetes bacterium]|nr:proteasome subunit alpha [Armatimonadota bacterium]
MSGTFAELVGFPGTLGTMPAGMKETRGTTVLALRYEGGILNLGDRRATAANYVMYDRAEKVMPLDDSTLIAISGSYARSIEIVRYLKHSFKYYSRTQLQDLSLEGKLQEVTRALSGNLPMTLDGVGIFIPLISAYDPRAETFGIYFYDAMGARFESGDFGAAGSGSERIRGIFDYITRVKGDFDNRPLADVLRDGLTMLDIAAQLDSATGGLDRIPPLAMVVEAEGIRKLAAKEIAKAVADVKASDTGQRGGGAPAAGGTA